MNDLFFTSDKVRTMTNVEAARLIKNTKQCHSVRPSKTMPKLLEVVPWDEKHESGGWTLFDLFSASAVVAVADVVKPEHLEKLNLMHFTRTVSFCMGCVK